MKKILSFCGSNLDTLIALVISIAAAIYGIFSSNELPLLAGIAAALGILCFGLIRDRINREALAKQIGELKMSLPDRPSAMAFFRQMKDFDNQMKNAFKIDLCGVSLTGTISSQFATLRSKIEAGAEIRVLVIDPRTHAIEMTAERSMNPKDTMYYRKRLDSTLSQLTYLCKFADEMKQNSKKGSKLGSLTVKMLSYAPSFAIISLDSCEKSGVIQIEIFPHKYGFKARPTFVLTAENDEDWYTYFAEQFEQMWQAATLWDPTPYIKEISFEFAS